MVDTLGWRMKFGVLAPSTNTSVEPEYAWMQPRGVTNHFCRMWIADSPIDNDADFEKLIEDIREATIDALDRVMTCNPGFVILGVSAETFWDGAGGAEQLRIRLQERAGVGITLGSHACEAALKTYGSEKPIKRIGVLTPYMPVGDDQVERFFTEIGYDVVKVIGLKSASPVLIAHEPPDKLRESIKQLNELNVDAIIQCGTNLACVKVAAEAEQWLEKPIIAINAATYWHALRINGIKDKLHGFGRLLEDW